MASCRRNQAAAAPKITKQVVIHSRIAVRSAELHVGCDFAAYFRIGFRKMTKFPMHAVGRIACGGRWDNCAQSLVAEDLNERFASFLAAF